jgi:hypothetical protein
VAIYTDLNSGDKIFVTWSLIPVIRFIDAPKDKDKGKDKHEEHEEHEEDDEDDEDEDDEDEDEDDED